MTQTDTPDFQRGVVSAQKLLASVAPGVTRQAVSVPPNAETLVIVATEQNAISTISVTGNTTGISCPLSSISAPEGSGNSPTWYVDVSSALDDAVTVSITFGVASAWYVYADSGVHMVSDTNKAVNNQRVQYTIPIPPDTASGDHPYNELQLASGNFGGAATALLAAPGAGKRYRLFGLHVAIITTPGYAVISQAPSGTLLASCPYDGGLAQQFLPSGLPLATNAGIDVATTGTSIAMAGVTYTLETV